jgi:hypothetical protein
MKSFKTYITEVMDNPYEYISITQSLERYQAGFLTGSNKAYIVYLYLEEDVYESRYNTVEILFGKININDRYKISSLEDLRNVWITSISMKLQPINDLEEALRIFATVKQIVKDYMSLATKNYDIEKIVFSADTNEPSRVKMYDLLTSKLAKELNLDIETDHDGDSKSYALRKTS